MFHLYPKQGVAFFSTASEILYGRAAGGGEWPLIRAGRAASSRGPLSINVAVEPPAIVLSWSGWRHLSGPASASIQNNSGLPQKRRTQARTSTCAVKRSHPSPLARKGFFGKCQNRTSLKFR